MGRTPVCMAVSDTKPFYKNVYDRKTFLWEYAMPPPADRPSPLPVQRAFVVQLHADTGVAAGHITGRVEHVVSGQAASFTSTDALLSFMAQVLREGQRT